MCITATQQTNRADYVKNERNIAEEVITMCTKTMASRQHRSTHLTIKKI